MNRFSTKLRRLFKDDEEEAADKEPEVVIACRQAAEKGDAAAQARLGDMYYSGEDIPQDYALAAEWYRKAAEQGHAAAQFQLGNMCRIGLGVLQSNSDAIMWLRKAGDQGDAASQALLGTLVDRAPAWSSDFIEVVTRLHGIAEKGQAGAQLLLGSMYATGNGVNRDPVTALAWVELALEQLEPGPLREAGLHQQSLLAAALSPEDQARARQRMAELRGKPRV
jgi:TPR repeat protein